MLRIVEVTNNPVAYRVPIYELIARDPELEATVIFCAAREPGRKSDVPPLRFPNVVLKEQWRARGDRHVHNNIDVFGHLRRLNPDVVITDGFYPTCLYAALYAITHGKALIQRTDGTLESERGLGWKHRAIRRLAYRWSQAFLGASQGSRRLFESYGIAARKIFEFPLCVDNARYAPRLEQSKRYDLLFCSRLVDFKRPLAAIDVAEATARKLGREVSLLIVGSGALEEAVRERAAAARRANVTVQGFAPQADLPDLYRSASVFLFPTQFDPWGVVVNEACAAGLPVIATPQAGTAGELVLDEVNGYVRELDVDTWADCAVRLLSNPHLRARFSTRSLELVSRYNFGAAARNLVDAARFAFESKHPTQRLGVAPH